MGAPQRMKTARSISGKMERHDKTAKKIKANKKIH